jgi:hypothetical protein
MLHAWAAAAGDMCGDALPDGDGRVIDMARKTLTEYETVSAMRRELFTRDSQDLISPRFRELAQVIDNITTWYAAQAASVLFLRGHHDYADAYRLAQLAHDLFPNESDPWIDRVRGMTLEESVNLASEKR